MEFYDPNKATNSTICAQYFCSTVHRAITFIIKNIRNEKCVLLLDELRSKFILARDTILTLEQITENVGAQLFRWRAQIEARDDTFFERTSIAELVGTDSASRYVRDEDRMLLYRATTPETRAVLFDALNLLLILYARYCMQVRASNKKI